MSIISPEIEYVDRSAESIRYLEHGFPSDLCRWHNHEEFELHLILETHGRTFIGDYIGDFKPGSLFLTGPYVPHNWITDKAVTETISVRDMLVQFNPQTMVELALNFPEFNEIQTTLDMANSGIELVGYNKKKAYEFLCGIRDKKGPQRITVFLEFLVSIHNHKHKKILSLTNAFQPANSDKYARIADVIDHVSKNFTVNTPLNKAANMAGMSTTSFSRNFQKITGKNFVEFVNSVRISQACSHLYASDYLISTICYKVGFQNLANFNRQFIKMKGMSPSEYRELAQNELN